MYGTTFGSVILGWGAAAGPDSDLVPGDLAGSFNADAAGPEEVARSSIGMGPFTPGIIRPAGAREGVQSGTGSAFGGAEDPVCFDGFVAVGAKVSANDHSIGILPVTPGIIPMDLSPTNYFVRPYYGDNRCWRIPHFEKNTSIYQTLVLSHFQ